jgi:hypothetical protein
VETAGLHVLGAENFTMVDSVLVSYPATVIFSFFYAKADHFAKTGSGQT